MYDRMIGGTRSLVAVHVCAPSEDVLGDCAAAAAQTSPCLRVAGSLSVFPSVSVARAPWDINNNMQQQHHLYQVSMKGWNNFLNQVPPD